MTSTEQRSPIVVSHNFYQLPGGEDEVFRSESRLLAEHGHEVVPYVADNTVIGTTGGLGLAGRTVWNRDTYRELRRLCQARRPRVVHFHNTFPLLSPSVYYAARAEGVPVVQTLHNFRLACPNALFFRQGAVCKDCVGKAIPWPGVVHACYRGSRPASAATAAMLGIHRALGTYHRRVDVFVALTEFARAQFIAAGLPADRMAVKPNFLHPDPGVGEHRGQFALFVGRLSPEKGIGTLIRAWEPIGERFALKVVGDGPEKARFGRATPGVEWLGWRSKDDVLALMRDAAFLVLPSEWYENFPMTLVEAYASALPVIASDLGSLGELVRAGETGLSFPPGQSDELAAAVEWAMAHPEEMAQFGRAGRDDFERRYSAESNYRALMAIYDTADANARRSV